jgi:hypothetical protein
MESKLKMKHAITAKELVVCPVQPLILAIFVLEMMDNYLPAKQYVEIKSKPSMSNVIMETRLDAQRTVSWIWDTIGTQL